MHAGDEELDELRQRIAALERKTVTLSAAIDWFGRWTPPEPVHSLRAARIATGLGAIAEASAVVPTGFDWAADTTWLSLKPELARFLGVAERVQADDVTAALARRMMVAAPVSAAGRHKLLALADALERLCTEPGARVLIAEDPVAEILDGIADPAPLCGATATLDLLREDDLPIATLDRDGGLVIREALVNVIVEFIYELVDQCLGAPDAEDPQDRQDL